MGRKLMKELGDNKSIKRDFRMNFKADGTKYYLCYKLVDIQLYKTAHGWDVKRSSKAERGEK